MPNLVFLDPVFGILAFFIGVFVLVLYIIVNKKSYIRFKFIDDLEKVFGTKKKLFRVNLVFIFLIFLTFSIIIGNPHLKNTKKTIQKDGIDIVLVLDLSLSMIAQDMPPNRLELAKQVVADFTSNLETDRIGLIVFSGKPFTSIPLTFDYNFVTNFVKNITINTINQDYYHMQGTAIGDALLYGANLFDDDDREKVIVLLTDGEANRGIEPIQAVRYIIDKDIKIHTVGIAGDDETYIVYGGQRLMIGGIDEENLQAIATLTDGEYYRVRDDKTFYQIFENLNLLEKKEIQIQEYSVLVPYYKVFVYVLFILLYFFVVLNFYYFIRD